MAGSRVAERVGVLPADTTNFLGRRHELGEIKRLLPESRLVTLTGPGGVGKTRLALRAAQELQRAFHHRVWFVELAELRDPALLANTVADQLGVVDQSGRPAIEAIMDHLPSGPVLLVLDNCEHLVDACATFVDTLIRACPEVRVLATSRQSLGLLAERRYLVTPLPAPDPQRLRSVQRLTRYASVQLFVERATAVYPGFTLDETTADAVARICRDLDGIPLAIELAAVRLRSLSVGQIAERLGERYRLLSHGVQQAPARQRTLQALIDWSYELCSPQERLAWARASVFSGSFDLDAVESIASGGDVATDDILDLVDSLVDKAVLLRDEGEDGVRYRMLETIREYGEAKLAALDERDVVRRRHRDWYAQLTTQFAAKWHGPDQIAWVRRLRRDHANLRLALEFCSTEPGEATVGLRMATQIDDYWGIRGLHTEARHWLDQTLPTAGPSRERIAALRLDGWFSLLQGDIDRGTTLLAEAVDLADRLDDKVERAYLIHAQAMALVFLGDLEQAATMFTDTLERFRAAGELRGELFTLFMFGLTVGVKGDRERGLALLDECLEITSRLSEEFWRSYALWSIAFIEVLHGSVERAEQAGKDALGLQQPMENLLALAFTIDTLGWIAECRERHARAATLFGAAAAVWSAIGASPDNYVPFADPHHDHLDRARSALGGDDFQAAFDRGREMSLDDAISYALETKPEAQSAPAAAAAPAEAPASPLTRRERQIAELVAEGLSNRDIAARLVIAQRTAEAHVENILTKLGFTSRAQIAAWMAETREDTGDDIE